MGTWACYSEAQLAELNLNGEWGKGVINFIVIVRGLEEEKDHEIPTTCHKKKRISLERGTTSRGPEKEKDHCEIPTIGRPQQQEDQS